MDAHFLRRKLLLTPSGDPRRSPEKQTMGTATASQKMLTLQALLSSLSAGAAKGGFLGRGEVSVTLPALQKTFVDLCFTFAWGFGVEKWRGFLVIFFWSPFLTK